MRYVFGIWFWIFLSGIAGCGSAEFVGSGQAARPERAAPSVANVPSEAKASEEPMSAQPAIKTIPSDSQARRSGEDQGPATPAAAELPPTPAIPATAATLPAPVTTATPPTSPASIDPTTSSDGGGCPALASLQPTAESQRFKCRFTVHWTQSGQERHYDILQFSNTESDGVARLRELLPVMCRRIEAEYGESYDLTPHFQGDAIRCCALTAESFYAICAGES